MSQIERGYLIINNSQLKKVTLKEIKLYPTEYIDKNISDTMIVPGL